jgi:hypothetical protein
MWVYLCHVFCRAEGVDRRRIHGAGPNVTPATSLPLQEPAVRCTRNMRATAGSDFIAMGSESWRGGHMTAMSLSTREETHVRRTFAHRLVMVTALGVVMISMTGFVAAQGSIKSTAYRHPFEV